MTVTNRQVMEQQMARCGVRDRYVCSFPRRHECRTGLIPDKSTLAESVGAVEDSQVRPGHFAAGCTTQPAGTRTSATS
jgi:hypothetical protein